MNSTHILSVVKNYINLVSEYYYEKTNKKLFSFKQKFFIMFGIHMMILTNSINWEKFQRMSFGGAVKASNLAGESLVSKGGNVPCCSEH